jgi:hypothetical protein
MALISAYPHIWSFKNSEQPSLHFFGLIDALYVA